MKLPFVLCLSFNWLKAFFSSSLGKNCSLLLLLSFNWKSRTWGDGVLVELAVCPVLKNVCDTGSLSAREAWFRHFFTTFWVSPLMLMFFFSSWGLLLFQLGAKNAEQRRSFSIRLNCLCLNALSPSLWNCYPLVISWSGLGRSHLPLCQRKSISYKYFQVFSHCFSSSWHLSVLCHLLSLPSPTDDQFTVE